MIVLTGANGYLAQSILRQLKDAGKTVGAIVYSCSKNSFLANHCKWVSETSLDDVETLTGLFQSADVVIHTAALIDIRRGHLSKMEKVNVEGTKNVLEACRRAGVRRLVYVGSIEAINLTSEERPVREDFGLALGNAIMDYGNTKADASRFVLRAGLEGNLETVVLCPSGIIGPWDIGTGLFTKTLRKYLRRRISSLVQGGFDFVDVRDVAGAIVAATEKGRSGEIYLLSGNYMELSQLFKLLEQLSGIKAPRKIIPHSTASFIASLMEFFGNLCHKSVPLTRGSLEMLRKNVQIDSTKARKELGFSCRPVKSSLADALAWLKSSAKKKIDIRPWNIMKSLIFCNNFSQI